MQTPVVTPIPEATESVVPVAMRALEAMERKDYALGLGLALMVVTFFAAKVATSKMFVPKEFTSSILLGAAVLGGFGAALASGVPPMRAAFAFLACSSTAIAFWEGVAKHVVKLWRWRNRRRRPVFTRKLTLMAIACGAVVLHGAPVEAAELIEPGIVLVRPDGTEVRIDRETILLHDEDVARLDGLLQELAVCREERDGCERRKADPAPLRKWTVLAVIAGAFVAGFCAERQSPVLTEDFQAP